MTVRAFLLLLACGLLARADPRGVVRDALADPRVRAALEFVDRNEPRVIEHQIALTEIPAPPFAEGARAEAYRKLFAERGLERVRIDGEGNVLGLRQGRQPRPLLVFSAHLDTVFPAETDVRVRRQGPVLHAPGIGDDGRGLAVVLGTIEALNHAALETDGSILFVGTVGEEGLGDLRGVKALFRDLPEGPIDRFVSVDGSGASIVNGGVGSYRYRVAYRGPGGHSYGSFGMTNPIHALGRLIARFADFEVPVSPKTTFNVGRIGGGTSVNSIADEAWLEADMRSEDKDALETLHAKFRRAAEEALADERRRWKNQRPLDVEMKLVGYRPPGKAPDDSPVVRAAVALNAALGLETALRSGSTDANVGMSLGVPSITIGGGGTGNGAHSPGESFDTTNSHLGTRRALLLAVALSSANLGD